MKLSFRSMAVVSAIGFIVLAGAWMFAPASVLSVWGVAFSYPVGLVSRRAAALYAGIAVMLFAARNAGPSGARSAIAIGFVATCLVLAALGVYELLTGHASRGILGAVILEASVSLLFIVAMRSDA